MPFVAKFLATGALVAVGCAGCNQAEPKESQGPVLSLVSTAVDGKPAVQSPSEEPATRKTSDVALVRVPNGGIQPQAVMDAKATLHLIYFKGDDATAGDLYYVRREAGKTHFSEPIPVNSRPRTACAAGSVRGGQIALGKGGRVHVVWNGVGTDYARLNDSGAAFEEQRNLMRQTEAPDGGGTVAADGAGNVYVVWHGQRKGDRGEDKRKVWVARSTDDGKTFSTESSAWSEPTGVCACCSTRAFADRNGIVYLLYRSATAEVHRDIYLLFSDDRVKDFEKALVHKWNVAG